MPTPTDMWRWWISDEITGKRRLTSFKMDRETALARYPGAEPDPRSLEVRQVFGAGEELPRNTKPVSG